MNIDENKTSHTIRDLKNNTEYSISLRATSKAEWGRLVSLNVKTEEYCELTNYAIRIVFISNCCSC